MLCVVIAYFVAIHKLILRIQNPMMHGAHSAHTLDDDSDQVTHPTIIADFIKSRHKGKTTSKLTKDSTNISRPINVASDGINYYVVLLESPYKCGESRVTTATTTHTKLLSGDLSDNYDGDDEEDMDMGSSNSISDV